MFATILTTTSATNHKAQIRATTSQTMSQLEAVMQWPMHVVKGGDHSAKPIGGVFVVLAIADRD
jgi:hypothetical protein